MLPDELRRPRDVAPTGNVWSTNVWTANVWNSGSGVAPAGAGTAPGAASPGKVLGTAQASAALPPATPFGGVAGGGFMLSNHAGNARMLPAPANAVGRGLDAYRAAPIPVTSRAVPPRAPL